MAGSFPHGCNFSGVAGLRYETVILKRSRFILGLILRLSIKLKSYPEPATPFLNFTILKRRGLWERSF
jgi:hypothetical protein